MKIAITDLTRFHNTDVCIAGLDLATNICVRPLPYLSAAKVIANGIRVGDILDGNFSPANKTTAPHVEDSNYTNIVHQGAMSTQPFSQLLQSSLSNDVLTGFNRTIQPGSKFIDFATPPKKSIITIEPVYTKIVADSYKTGKWRVCFIDGANHSYDFISLTDYWLVDSLNQGKINLQQINYQIANSHTILRVGLTRAFQPTGQPKAYWMQVNSVIFL